MLYVACIPGPLAQFWDFIVSIYKVASHGAVVSLDQEWCLSLSPVLHGVVMASCQARASAISPGMVEVFLAVISDLLLACRCPGVL